MENTVVSLSPFCAALAGLALLLGVGCGDSVVQPIAFSHKKHADKEVVCADCHKFNKTQTFSGLPTVADCMDCHDEALTKSPEEEKIRQAAKAGEPLVWKRLFKVPDHVYYSHRRHVTIAGIACERCHGAMGKTDRPPSTAPVKITMSFCLDCHKAQNANTDCVACHR